MSLDDEPMVSWDNWDKGFSLGERVDFTKNQPLTNSVMKM